MRPWLITALPLLFLAGHSSGQSAPAVAQSSAVETTSKPFLWRIEGNPPSYLFGTIHLPDPRVATIPGIVRQVIEQSDAVYTELAMDAVTQAKIAFKSFLPKGATLDEVLPEALYDRVDAYLQRHGLSIGVFSRFKVWVVTQTLTMADIMKDVKDSTVLDQRVYLLAQSLDKEVGGVETVNEQIGVFESLSLEQQIAELESTLSDLEESEGEDTDPLEELIQIYLSGDAEALMTYMAEEVDPDDPDAAAFMKRLLDDRNVLMAERIEAKLKANPDRSYFFAFGSAHFPGPMGVNRLLKKQGYVIRRVSPGPRRRLY